MEPLQLLFNGDDLGGKLDGIGQHHKRPSFIAKAYHALPSGAGFLFNRFAKARTVSITPVPVTVAPLTQIKIRTPTPPLGIGPGLSHPPSRAGPVQAKPSVVSSAPARSTSKKNASAVALPAARAAVQRKLIADPPAQTATQSLHRKVSVDAKRSVAKVRSPLEGTPPKCLSSAKSLLPKKSLLQPAKTVRSLQEQPDKALRASPEKVTSPRSSLEQSTKSKRLPAEQPDTTKKSPPDKTEKPEQSEEAPSEDQTKSRRSTIHELRTASEGHIRPKTFRSPLNVHTASGLKSVAYPRSMETQMSLPAGRRTSYMGTEINPFYRGSFLKVRVSKELLQSRLNPISQRTKEIEEEKKPKPKTRTKKDRFNIHVPNFCSKNLMRIVFGDPFTRMKSNPHYTFSWKKLFTFSGRSRSPARTSSSKLTSVPSGSGNKG